MARSLKKGPFVDGKLLKKVEKINDGGKKSVIKTCPASPIIEIEPFDEP